MSGGGSGTSTTVQKLPKYADDALRFGKDLSTGLYRQGNPPGFYPGATHAGLNQWQKRALAMADTSARQGGSPATQAGLSSALGTLRGDYLDDITSGNVLEPLDYDAAMGAGFDEDSFNDAVRAAAHPALTRTRSAFQAAGRSGSGLAAEAEADAIARAFAGQYGAERDRRAGLYGADRQLRAGLYGGERGNMIRAGALLPQYEALANAPSERLLQAGNIWQDNRQRQMAADRERWEYNARLGEMRVDDYLRRMAGVIPGAGYGATVRPTTSSPGMQALGGGMMGYQLAQGLGVANPWLGAGAGVLMGLLS